MDSHKKACLLFGLLGLGLPFMFVLIGLYGIGSRYYKLTTWEEIPAIVTLSEIVSGTNSEGSTLHRSKIEYHYMVNGKEHFGAFESASSNFSSSTDAIVNRYPNGATILIKVSPSNPSASTLPEKPSWLWYFFLFFGGLIFGIFFYAGLKLGLFGKSKTVNKKP